MENSGIVNRMRVRRKTPLLGAIVTVGFVGFYYQSCGSSLLQEAGSETLAPALQPIPSHREQILGCATGHSSVNRTWTDPVTKQSVTRVYRNSNDADYFRPGWENRVASSYTYLTEAHTGEPASRLRLVLIDVRTVNGVAYYHYYGNASDGRATHVTPVEPWSSSKVYGVAMAFHRMRYESNKGIGGTATSNGGPTIAQDMDVLNDISSNRLAGFYKALAGRRLATDMIQKWIQRPGETFGGFYSDNTYGSDQSFTFRSPSGASKVFTLRNDEYTSNSLSPLTIAEMVKRLGVGFKDSKLLPKMVDYSANPSAEVLKSAEVSLLEEDLRTLFYGSYRNGLGGMMYDGQRDIPHNIGGSARLNQLTQGKWRAFGKGGSGYSSSRGKDEESTGDWVCVPGGEGREGLEFAIYAHIEGPNKVARLHAAIKKTTQALFPDHWAAVNGQVASSSPSPDQVFANNCQEATAQFQICSDSISVISDTNRVFPAKQGEKVCRTNTTRSRNGLTEERVYFATAPRGYAWVAEPETNICGVN